MQIRELYSGSQVHIVQMKRAFEALGYEVTMISGPGRKRKQLIRQLKKEYTAGKQYDFVYAWAPTAPTLIGRNNKLYPILDLDFFRWGKQEGIRIGLFYGDVHWRFDHYRRSLGWAKYAVTLPLFWYDWIIYTRFIDHLFLPSLKMRKKLPTHWPENRMSRLLPGCNLPILPSNERESSQSEGLSLFYVGGILPPLYDLRLMTSTILEMDSVKLTICCREEEWKSARHAYGKLDPQKIRIVHAYGEQLEAFYAQADVFGLFWEPYPYLNITMPVKVFESMTHGLPIITTAGTVAAEFIEKLPDG